MNRNNYFFSIDENSELDIDCLENEDVREFRQKNDGRIFMLVHCTRDELAKTHPDEILKFLLKLKEEKP